VGANYLANCLTRKTIPQGWIGTPSVLSRDWSDNELAHSQQLTVLLWSWFGKGLAHSQYCHGIGLVTSWHTHSVVTELVWEWIGTPTVLSRDWSGNDVAHSQGCYGIGLVMSWHTHCLVTELVWEWIGTPTVLSRDWSGNGLAHSQYFHGIGLVWQWVLDWHHIIPRIEFPYKTSTCAVITTDSALIHIMVAKVRSYPPPLRRSFYFTGGQRCRPFLKEHSLYIAGSRRTAVYYNGMYVVGTPKVLSRDWPAMGSGMA
jgi:hypothetical protein